MSSNKNKEKRATTKMNIIALHQLIEQEQQVLCDRVHVASMMIKYGGGFIHNLGEALLRADNMNTVKIYRTWTMEWDMYNSYERTSNE